ncbi:MAG: hypothetical protein B6I22_11120 [Desulfobacteraceae bacterium 4572_123]|nr:MAG: hypothetical protein B6I22_11120 [Desulfobacteraceae bacterium 4572_123]
MAYNIDRFGDISFPQESANEVGQRFLELPPVPDFMTLKGPYIKGMKEEGIRALEIYELDKSKVAEGIEFVTDRCVGYFGISGYTYEINVYFEASEALKMIGLG